MFFRDWASLIKPFVVDVGSIVQEYVPIVIAIVGILVLSRDAISTTSRGTNDS